MTHFKWRAAALVVLTGSAFATYGLAQQASNSDQGNSATSKSSTSQDASSGSNQAQSQASNSTDANTSNTTNSQPANAQRSQDAKSSQDQTSANKSTQDRDDRSSTNSASERNSSSNSQAREDRDSARANRDDRSTTRDRSNRDSDRNVDSRSPNSDWDRDSSRDRSSHRDNMRGPDIGLWFNRSSRDGLVISDVSSKGAIARFGFREGDRIVSVNGQRVTREEDFIQYLLRGNSRRVTVIVFRDGREQTIYVEPAVLVDDREYTEVDPLERFGIIVDDRYDDRIVVWRVVPRSSAYYAGFRAGDVIVTFGGRPYRTRTEFERGSRDWKAGDMNVQIRRGDRTRDLSVEIPNADRSDRRNERTVERNSVTTDQGTTTTTERSDRKTNNTQGNTNRGGILNGVGRGRGNR